MISVSINTGKFSYKNIYFAHEPPWAKSASLACFTRCTGKVSMPLMVREQANTKIIDLMADVGDILSRFPKDTQYEVRRATRDGAVFHLGKSFSELYDHYHRFTMLKSMPILPRYYIEAHYPHLVVTTADLNGQVVCMHSYLADRDIGRAMLFTSSSLFRAEDNSAKRSMVGRTNRWLHYKAMLYFRELGFSTYDLGGYAVQTTDPGLQQINAFKDSFGGALVKECTYTTYPLWLARRVNKFFKNKGQD